MMMQWESLLPPKSILTPIPFCSVLFSYLRKVTAFCIFYSMNWSSINSFIPGTCFKPARLRNDKKLAFIPINLHIQRMKVMQDSEGGIRELNSFQLSTSKIYLGLEKVKTLGRFHISFTCFALALVLHCYATWLAHKCEPFCHPIRSKAEINCFPVCHVGFIYLEVLIGSLDCLCRLWLASWKPLS